VNKALSSFDQLAVQLVQVWALFGRWTYVRALAGSFWWAKI